MHILLVEDDKDIVRNLSELLSGKGYKVSSCATQDEALKLGLEPCDLVLLDVTLAQGNGFAVCNALKADKPDLPIIFLTASDDEFNIVTGLSMGADDYIAKPFRLRELLARIEAVLRRSQSCQKLITFGDVIVDPHKACARKDGVDLDLSAIEYKLLLLFASHAGSIVTREMIREALWEDAHAFIEDNTISVYIKRLRDKIEDDPQYPVLIKTIRGLGYRAHE